MADDEPAAKKARRNRWDASAEAPAPAPAPDPMAATAAAAAAAAVAARAKAQQAAPALDAAAISASVQSALAAAQQRAAALGTPSRAAANAPGGLNASTARMPTTVTLDAQGRLLDEHGKVIRSTGGVQSAKINQRETTNPLLEAAAPPDVTDNPYFDPRMAAPGHAREQRRKRAFNFVEEGRFSRKADDLRAKAAVEQLLREAKTKGGRKDISHPAPGEQLGVISQRPAVAVSAATLTKRLAELPAAEWWDLPLLRGTSYAGPPHDGLDGNMRPEEITHYVEHPVPVEPPCEPPPPPPQPLPLTKRERKKLRTQRRLAAEKEKQDQIRCGLLPPPPPKVKISNLMQAMKDEAVADPSALEARVRQEMAQRIKNHEERNQARKLTPAQRKEKKKRKLLNDPTGGGVPVTVYRVAEIPDKQKLYKIDINAQQNHLSGVALLVQGCSVVVVEGGPKAQKRYRKLLLHRIDWSDVRDRDDDSDDDEDERDEERRRAASEACQVVWEGRVVKPQFKSFRVEAARTPEAARKLLKERGCEHYWDMASRFRTGDDDDDEEEEDDDEDDEEEEGDGEGGAANGDADSDGDDDAMKS